MSYDRSKVNFTDKEHDQTQKIDASVEVIINELRDGFQPQDLVSMGPAGWGLYQVLAEIAKDFTDANARPPRVEEVAEIVGTRFLMLQRDNKWISRGKGQTANT